MEGDNVSLVPDLQSVLSRIVDDLLNERLSARIDYGTHPYSHIFVCNRYGSADDVLAFINKRVQELSHGRLVVVYADNRYFKTQSKGCGLDFALITYDGDRDIPNTKYFVIGASSNGVHFVERADDEVIAERTKDDVKRIRRQKYRRAGEGLLAKHTNALRAYVNRLLDSTTLTDEQKDDVYDLTNMRYERTLTLAQKVETLDLEKLYTILVIIGRTNLPAYN